MKKFIMLLSCITGLAAGELANATPIDIGSDRLLGVIAPGTPANPANELIEVNGLLLGWGTVNGYKTGGSSGLVMGNNPADPQTEVYKLLFSNPTKIPAPASAPVAVAPAYPTTTGNPLVNLASSSYAWILAKWGQDSAVYYIGDLIHGEEINLIQPNWAAVNIPKAKGGGLSGYTLFNETSLPTPPVPDCGVTACLLSFALCGIGVFGRKNR